MELNDTVVGGGNALHVMVAMLSAAGARVKVWASFQDEVGRFKEGMERNGGVQVAGIVEMKGTPADVTEYSAQGLADADVNLLALKPTIHLATYPADIDTSLSRLLCRVSEFVLCDKAAADMCRSFISIHLSTGNANVHLPRLYALVKDFEEGMSYEKKPLFYEGMDEFSVSCIQRVSDERMVFAKAIDASHNKFKGTADHVTSTIDVLLELLVKDADGKYQLSGSDVSTHTTAPQCFGIHSIEDLVQHTFKHV